MRIFPRSIKRIVIKVGSSVIANDTMKPRVAHLRSLVEQISQAKKHGIEIILVSSGAIVLGMGEMNLRKRPTELASLQTLAAIGQTILMRKYNEFFKSYKNKCAQVLLTWDDFNGRERFNNARNTFKQMLDWGIVPVVNENDTIATDEIKFGDNDKLSALVASMVDADLLLILSDVDGLYDATSGEKKYLREIKEITADIENVAGGTHKKEMSKGGMITKLQAIKIAAQAKVASVIANGEMEKVLTRVLAGESIGTYFVEKEEKLLARKHWISFGAKPKGAVVVDEGARSALLKGGRSLLLPGITACEGIFKKDDIVVICDKSGNEIARGISNYSNLDLKSFENKKGKVEVIHCDNMVLSQR